ncbi:hypothetical protein ACFVUY_42285 [Kitasatospora sp. NPDC058063]|uniref:hypothetical protein n=1 Tax=unclassified Kitasatospora TaxID=2633591 RepID=UPI0036DF6423
MTTWTPETLVRIDHTTDREYASNGGSRYATYVWSHRNLFTEFGELGDDDSTPVSGAEFAAAAWQLATPPTMAPAYASIRPDIRWITAHLDDDRELYFEVGVPLHHDHLTAKVPRTVDDWTTQSPVGGADDGFDHHFAPEGRRLAVATTATLYVPAQDWTLPRGSVAADDERLADVAAEYVAHLADRINRDAGRVVADLAGR